MNSRYILNIPLKWLAISWKCWTSSVTTSSLTLDPFLQRSVVSLSFHGTGVGSSYKKYRFSFSYPRWNRTIRNKVEIYICGRGRENARLDLERVFVSLVRVFDWLRNKGKMLLDQFMLMLIYSLDSIAAILHFQRTLFYVMIIPFLSRALSPTL